MICNRAQWMCLYLLCIVHLSKLFNYVNTTILFSLLYYCICYNIMFINGIFVYICTAMNQNVNNSNHSPQITQFILLYLYFV